MNSMRILRNCTRGPITPRCSQTSRNFKVVPPVLVQEDPPISTIPKQTKKESHWLVRKYQEFMSKPSRHELVGAGTALSSCCLQDVRFKDFFETFDMPDTYMSWFLVTELHIYMISNRLQSMVQNKDEAQVVMKSLQESLWKDCSERMKLLGQIPVGKRNKFLSDLSQQFFATLIFYDKGLVANDDIELATVLWRRFFELQEPDGPRLELLLKYVRQTMSMLDDLPNEHFIKGGRIIWLNLEAVNKST